MCLAYFVPRNLTLPAANCGSGPLSSPLDNGPLLCHRFAPNEQNGLGDRRGARLAFPRRIPGLKRETWATHRVSRRGPFEGPIENEPGCLTSSFPVLTCRRQVACSL